MILPSLHALGKIYPSSQIDFLTLDGNQDVLRGQEFINEVFAINDTNFFRFLFTCIRNLLILRRKRYNIIIDFEQFARFSVIFAFLIRAKKRIGFNTWRQFRDILLTDPVKYYNNIHMTNSYYSLLKPLWISKEGEIKAISLVFTDKEKTSVNLFLVENNVSDGNILINLHMTTSNNFPLRRWPMENFAKLARMLIEKYDAKLVFSGLSQEKRLIEKTKVLMEYEIIDACGLFNIAELAFLIKRCNLVISCDTASVHIASCVGTPVIGLYGPNTPVLYGPWGNIRYLTFYKSLPCSPCITNYNAKINRCRNPEGHGVCMQRISVDEVFGGVEKILLLSRGPSKQDKINNFEKIN